MTLEDHKQNLRQAAKNLTKARTVKDQEKALHAETSARMDYSRVWTNELYKLPRAVIDRINRDILETNAMLGIHHLPMAKKGMKK
jgi:hypothetical protein